MYPDFIDVNMDLQVNFPLRRFTAVNAYMRKTFKINIQNFCLKKIEKGTDLT